jgi:hypothetical protein
MRSVFVVFANDQHWQMMQRDEVEHFVGDALVEYSVADDRHAHIVKPAIFLSEGGTERDEERACDDRAAVEVVVVGAELHRAGDARVRARPLAIEFRHHRVERGALR